MARAAPSDPLFTYTKKAVKKDEVRFDFLTVPLARERERCWKMELGIDSPRMVLF